MIDCVLSEAILMLLSKIEHDGVVLILLRLFFEISFMEQRRFILEALAMLQQDRQFRVPNVGNLCSKIISTRVFAIFGPIS